MEGLYPEPLYEIFDTMYDPLDLEPIIEALNYILDENVKMRVFTEWLFGVGVAIFALLIVLIFATFISNYK